MPNVVRLVYLDQMHNLSRTPTTELITTAEAAELIGRTVHTLSRWVAAGRLQPVKKLPGLRGGFLFDRAQVQALATPQLTAKAN